MKKSLILAMALSMGIAGTAMAANPFSDVPANSWAYAAVEKLAAEGIVDGMGNGKFEGNRNMTRYEMAQITAKAMAKGVQKPELKKLAAEFAQELNAMGVRVGKVEEKVQISGEFRLRYRGVNHASKSIAPTSDDFQFRTRLHLRGKINKNWSAYMMLENIQNMGSNSSGTDAENTVNLRRAMAVGKYDKLQVQLGRIPYSDKDSMLFNPLELDGITLAYNFGAVKATALYGRFQPFKFSGTRSVLDSKTNTKITENARVDSMGLALEWDISKQFNLAGAFYNHRQKTGYTFNSYTANVYDLLATYKMKDWKFSAMYIGSSNEIEKGAIKNGYSFRIGYGNFKPTQKGSYLLQASYLKIPVAAYNGSPYQLADLTSFKSGVKGWTVAGDYALEKNVRLHVSYADIKGVTEKVDKTKIYTGYLLFYF